MAYSEDFGFLEISLSLKCALYTLVWCEGDYSYVPF